jgi:hypothetical protein
MPKRTDIHSILIIGSDWLASVTTDTATDKLTRCHNVRLSTALSVVTAAFNLQSSIFNL